jgi:hypothetical protein
MKSIKNLLLLAILALFVTQPVQSQSLLKKIQKRAEKQVEKRLEKKAEEQVDKELDKAEERIDEALESDEEESGNNVDSKLSKEDRLQNMMKGLGLSGEPVPIAENYRFSHLIQMHFESFNKNGKKKDEGEFITHFDPESKNMAYQALSGDAADKGLFIIDTENGAIIILSDDGNEKNGIVYGMSGYFSTMGESFDEEELDLSETPDTYLANPNVNKTGRTKTISGFKCEEYVYEDEYSKSNIWITKDIKLNAKDFMSSLFKTSMVSHGMGWGYMMEATTVEKDSGEKSVMQVTKVDDSSNIGFNMGDYQITNLGSFQPPEEN